ncbi:MAG: hypothetical protein R3C24_02060 [Cyanobacteriota/Melainabacteria group bacterium]
MRIGAVVAPNSGGTQKRNSTTGKAVAEICIASVSHQTAIKQEIDRVTLPAEANSIEFPLTFR